MFGHLKFKMSATFVLKKEPPFFVMDGATDMNVGVF